MSSLLLGMLSFVSDWVKQVSSFVPPGLPLALGSAYIANGEHLASFRQELVGTLLMIIMTFSAGSWIGSTSRNVAWVSHAAGVIASDYIAGGPHVNPAVTLSMYCLAKVGYTEAYVRVAAQMAGGLIAFPLFHAISVTWKLQPFGGPEYKHEQEMEAAVNEFLSTLFLLLVIYLLNWELNFGKTYHYITKQFLTAVAIRILIQVFSVSGPAMNPMLATCWYVFGVGNKFQYPDDIDHYFVYWIAPAMAAILASALYVMYAGGTFFGVRLPVGPFKPQAKTTTTAAASEKKDK